MNLEYAEYDNVLFDDGTLPFVYRLSKTVGDDYPLDLRWHEQMEIKYIVSGKMEIVCNSQVHCVEEGDLIIINPYERHTNHVAKGTNVTYHMLLVDLSENFTGFLFDRYFAPYLRGEYRFGTVIRKSELVKKALDMFGALCADDAVRPIKTYGLFLDLFSHLQKDKTKMNYPLTVDRSENSKCQENIVTTTLNYIFEHYAEPIKLSEVAKLCFITEEHLCRTFKAVVGKSPKNFIVEFRIGKAEVFMLHSKLSIKEVAGECGFKDSAYFCRCFKKYKGISPSEFIRLSTANKEERS